MALLKTISASASYITPNALTALNGTVTFTPAVSEAVVQDGVLKVSDRIKSAGVFTQGTPTEGSASYTQADSNG